MLSVVFKNTEFSSKKLGCSRATIYRWLDGQTPTLATLIKINEVFKINITLEYLHNFFSTIQQLNAEEIDKINALIEKSYIEKEDKAFLKEHFKKKYWNKNGR